MNLSCLPVSYFGKILAGEMSIGDWAEEAASLGLDAIDLSILFLESHDSKQLDNIRQQIESAEMRVAVVTTYPDFTHPDADERKRQMNLLKDNISKVAAVGSEMIRITAGQAHPETGREEGIRWATEGLKHSIDTAESCGLQLLFENHAKPGAWHYTDFAQPTDIFLEISDALAGTPIKILFDTANPLAYGDDPLFILERVIDRVLCIHASDTRIRGSLEPVVVGTGLVPFVDIFARLKKANFDQWISIEEASGQGKSGLEKAASFVRRTWAETK